MKIVTLEEHIRYLLQLSEKYYSSSSGGKFDLNDAEYFVKIQRSGEECYSFQSSTAIFILIFSFLFQHHWQ